MIETNASELPQSVSVALCFFVPALFLSSFLLFLVEPLVGKMVLPLLGGAPAVWNTCVMFFEMTLLAGYAFAHVTSTRLRLRHQTIAYVGLLAIPFAVLISPATVGRAAVVVGLGQPASHRVGSV